MPNPIHRGGHTATGLRDRRLAAGMNQTELAEAAGCQQSTISQIETGTRRGGVDLLAAIARVLGCTVDDLITQAAA